MTTTHSRTRFGAFTFFILLMASAAGTGGSFQASAAVDPSGGLVNPGFEGGSSPWTFSGPDFAGIVTGSDDPLKFAAYANTPDGSVTVSPKTPGSMARLGTPKDLNSSQPAGINSVSQTFTPTTGTVSFSAWLFSWEHRGNDTVSFEFKNAVGDQVGVFALAEFKKKQGNTTIVSCAGAGPCSKAIDVGNRGDYLNSGWVTVTVTNLPTGVPVTFKASVGSTANNAHASWLYLDEWVNSPPVAAFNFSYPRVSLTGGVPTTIDSTTGTGPLEGSPIQLKDLSTDPDPGDKIVAWEWTVTGLNGPLLVQNPFFVPNNDGVYSLTLIVTDSFGARSLPVTREIVVLNAPPLVNALNIEAIAGAPFPVLGRFSDAGWDDTHTASWSIGLTAPLATVQEDHAAALGTGKVTGTAAVATATTTPGNLTVSDGVNSKTDPFTVKTLADTSTLLGHTEFLGPNGARPVAIDGSYLGVVPAAGSRSIYEIKWPTTDGSDQPLPGGSEILVNLKDLPADYDLILVTTGGQQSAGYAFSGYAFSGFAFSGYAFSDLPNLVSPYAAGYAFSGTGTAGYAFSGIQRAAYGEAGYAFSDASAAGYAFSGYAFSGYAFSGYAFSDSGFGSTAFAPYAVAGYAFSPISQMGFTGLSASSASPSDVSLSELGLGQIPAGTSIVGYSANRGKGGETVLARIDSPGTKLYAIVVGANGAFSPEPFRIDVEGSMTITAAALNSTTNDARTILNGGTCAPRFTEPAFVGGASVIHANSAPTTLFVTQKERLKALHPADDWTGLTGFLAKMNSLALHPAVNGKIISVDSGPYTAWDAEPCSIEAANDVSEAVRAAILAELKADQLKVNPTIKYVVILGDDDVIPFRRVPDQVSIGNERSYLSSSFLKQGTPLYASVAGGYNLTDDCNTDFLPTPWQGRELCIPDKVISRLVETPTEIAAQAQAFMDSNGLLDAATEKTGLVAGYDFFTDGSIAVANALKVFLTPVNELLIRDNWTADDLRCSLLGIGAGCAPSSIADANAHFTHYAGLSANGFKTGQFTDVLTSTDVKKATSTAADINKLAGKLVYTIGCHAGFSAPDRAINYDPNLGIDARLDFAQAFAQARAVYIASTGYGIGDDSGIAGTERLIVLYAQELGKGKSAGQALVDAKRYYLSSLPAASVYDEKSSINLTLYGLPMYSLGITAATSPLTVAIEALSTEFVSETIGATLKSPAPPQGNYYVVTGGDAAAPPYRPLQPRKVFPVTNTAAGPVHGILWTSGGFTDTPNFNPVIARPSVEWEANPTEPQVCYDGFWPSEIFRVNTLDNAQGQIEQTVVVTPGQFRCDGLVGGEVRGTQRVFTVLGWEVLRSASADVTPPSLTGFDLDLSSDPLYPLALKVGAMDPVVGAVQPSGISRIVVLRINSVSKAVDKLADTQDTLGGVPSGTFDINIANPGNDRLIIQIVDAAGNVGLYSAKGPGLRILGVDLAAVPQVFGGQPNAPITFTATAFPNGELIVGPVSYFWDFGDGATATTSTNSVSRTIASAQAMVTVKVRVTDSNGGIGVARVAVHNMCSDPPGDTGIPSDVTINAGQADFVGCAVSHAGTPQTNGTITITLSTASALKTTTSSWPPKIRYTVNVAVGKGGAKNLSYREGSATGLSSLVVTLSGNTISFTFAQKDIGWAPGKTLTWFADTQGGVEGTQGAGSLDHFDQRTYSAP